MTKEEENNRFFTKKIYEVEREIGRNRESIKKLSIELKRERAELAKLRRELDKDR